MNVVEPYHPDRVLRQFGRVQNIPAAPIPPVATNARRGTTSTTYTRVRYQFLESIWENWYNHVIAEGRRSIPLHQSSLSYTDDYMEWYREHGVLRVHNPLHLPDDVALGAPHFQPTYNQLYSVCFNYLFTLDLFSTIISLFNFYVLAPHYVIISV